MSARRQLVLASNNPGKLREFSGLFANHDIELVPQFRFEVPEAAEPHLSFVENALAKARHACLLYTSDAADERSSVDLGGRRIIKKKKKLTGDKTGTALHTEMSIATR